VSRYLTNKLIRRDLPSEHKRVNRGLLSLHGHATS